MLKFFGNIRKTLIKEDKTTNYLKYAIGEIILVVIGILIALQVNNLNEKRKINNDIESVFTLLENELETNIKESTNFLKYGFQVDSIQTLFDQNKVTPEMIRSNNYLLFPFGTNTIKFQDDRLIEIIALEKQFPNQYQGLISDIKLVKNLIDEHRFWERRALDLAAKKTEEYVDKYSWFVIRDSITAEKAIHHRLTDTIYRNNISHYSQIQLNENVWYASLMRTASVALLWQIKSIKGMDKSYTIKQYFNELELKPLMEFACSDKPFKENEINFRRNFIIYNKSKDSISFHFINKDGERLFTRTIPPEKFVLKYFSMQPHQFIELEVENECKKVYKQNKEDYLIFE